MATFVFYNFLLSEYNQTMSKVLISEDKSRTSKLIEGFFLALGTALFITGIVLCRHFHFFSLFPNGSVKDNVEAGANISMELTGMLVCCLLYFSVMLNNRSSKFRTLFLKLIFCENLVLFTDAFSWLIGGKPELNTLLITTNCVFYICAGMIQLLFWGTEMEVMNLEHSIPKTLLYGIRVAAVIYFASVFLNLKFGFYYVIQDGMYIRTSSYTVEYLFPLLICAVLLFYALTVKNVWKIKVAYIVIAVVPILVILLQTFAYSLSMMYMSILAAIIILYINVHVSLGMEIEEFRNKVMISQIQPHFMYNTLTTIKALCKVEPELAAKTITNFADYLRGNMDFASLEATIPLEKELNHTKIYTEIEALRFDNITFEFKIEDSDFEIPALCIQPMVENAVRHGVRSRKDGHILIHTFQDQKYHNIVIQDNGKGFDNAQFNGSRTHIGLLNTRLRIERLVHGIFEVESVPEKGVKITMRIPK